MQTELLNIGLGFIEGLGLILSPCILPILPIILAGSLEGSKKRPLGIIVGFVILFAIFTFFSRKLVQYSGIDLSLIRYVSYALLFLFGVVMLSTYLTEQFARLTQRLAQTGSSLSINRGDGGFFRGMMFGGLIGLVWTPCAGPILAAVIVQTVLQKSNLIGFFIVLAFGIGAAIPMFIIAIFGRTIMNKLSFIKTHTELFRKILGAIIIASVVYMIYGEGISLSFAKSTSGQASNVQLINGLATPYPAPEIAGITNWINSPPLTLSQLKGKVVLVDFWTYSCINCLRTLPYLKDWYSKYHDKGFEIIGVHSPEFEFEKNVDNVKKAVADDGIKYPVALDSNFVTWQNFQNSYWPAHYLIDKTGRVVYTHFGEGDYDTTENNIRFLLGMDETKTPANFGEENASLSQTPETYLGFARMEHYASPEAIVDDRTSHYSFPVSLDSDAWALQGDWKVEAQQVISTTPNGAVKIHFNARKVFVVMGSSTGFPITVKVSLNGEGVIKEKGKDVINGEIIVNQNKLYEVLVLPGSSSGILQLTASTPGLEIYTFTFGG